MKKLNEAAVGAITTPAVQERLAGLGATVAGPNERVRNLGEFVEERSQEMGSADQGKRRAGGVARAAAALRERVKEKGSKMADIKISIPTRSASRWASIHISRA